MIKFKDMSFKIKTILGVAFIESILLAIIYFTSINSLNETNENQIKSRSNETSSLIALWVRNGLLTYDVGNTEHFIDSLVQSDGLVYVHIKNDEGKTFAFAGDKKYLTTSVEQDYTLEQANRDGVFDTVKPVMVDDIEIGQVELGLSVEKLSTFIDDVSHRIKVIAIVEVFLSALFSFFLGWVLTRRLGQLKEVAIKVKNTGNLVKIGDHANDEIGMVSQAFDQMSASLIKTQIKLKSNSMKLEEIFNNTKDGMIVFSLDGTILTVNPAFMNLVNCYKSVEGATYESFVEMIRKEIDFDDYESVKWLRLIDTFKGIEDVSNDNWKIRFAKPNTRLLNVSQKIINDTETQIHSIFFFTDLTKTEEVERLKSEFLAHAAHELRTPLSSVQGFSELLIAPTVSDDMRVELATIINTQSQRVVALVGDLLDVSKIETEGAQNFDFQQVLVVDIVDKVIRAFAIPEGRETISVKYSNDLGTVNVDFNRIYQVLLNLVSNAYKYSSIGGVNVFVEHFETEVENNTGVEIRVVDSGIGMTEEQVSHVFDKFWRADMSGEIPGTGLGMSIVKDIIELHSGTIEVNSELGRGTEVVVKFYR
ncbi:ATP-binding protein [Thiomicrorhabdus lithotrophica]|uniref:histidine kinase n=1 Tax=Thiomicrorhabdus lithotrophica TaxID=2949997 RepID=A0ABY8C7E8_9GAMM|nr:ATP-binding protein [Thiomicrorhabdus lithotrophica]WEJ61834.1 ATP-binding protein [Thiomicrorhabdus lithotrophica]